jgi:hypothetical protein
MIKFLDSVFRIYRTRGFVITDLHTDNEFACIREHVLPVHFNPVAANGHVGEVERSIRTIKERNRTTVYSLPFKRLPRLVVQEITKHSVTKINFRPTMESPTHSAPSPS